MFMLKSLGDEAEGDFSRREQGVDTSYKLVEVLRLMIVGHANKPLTTDTAFRLHRLLSADRTKVEDWEDCVGIQERIHQRGVEQTVVENLYNRRERITALLRR